MKFAAAPILLLSVFPAPTLSDETCNTCAGFDESLMIAGSLGTQVSEGQDIDIVEGLLGNITSCAQLKASPFSDLNNSCVLFDWISTAYCGCVTPPADGCFRCSDGSTILNLDGKPKFPSDFDFGSGSADAGELPPDLTCRELALQVSITSLFLAGLADAFGAIGGASGGEVNQTALDEIDDALDCTKTVGLLCGGCSSGASVTSSAASVTKHIGAVVFIISVTTTTMLTFFA